MYFPSPKLAQNHWVVLVRSVSQPSEAHKGLNLLLFGAEHRLNMPQMPSGSTHMFHKSFGGVQWFVHFNLCPGTVCMTPYGIEFG